LTVKLLSSDSSTVSTVKATSAIFTNWLNGSTIKIPSMTCAFWGRASIHPVATTQPMLEIIAPMIIRKRSSRSRRATRSAASTASAVITRIVSGAASLNSSR
jgi:hypothetical protein